MCKRRCLDTNMKVVMVRTKCTFGSRAHKLVYTRKRRDACGYIEIFGTKTDARVVWEEVIPIIDALRRRFDHVMFSVTTRRVQSECLRQEQIQRVAH